MKKALFTLSAILSIILSALCLTLTASATDDIQRGTWGELFWEWNQTTGKLVLSGEGRMEHFEQVSDSAWRPHKDSIKSVTIENGITNIGAYAFASCSNLTDVSISSSITEIGVSAFERCRSLKSITIPNSVTRIESKAFTGCTAFTSITVPNSVTSIGSSAFSSCASLNSVTLPTGLTSIEESVFASCHDLTSFVIPNSVISIEANAFRNCSDLTSITIPNSVTSIGERAFTDCHSLTSVTIPGSVESIGEYAYSNCSKLVTVTISDGVKSIGSSAFSRCSNLLTVMIPDSITSIGYAVFFNCNQIKTIIYCGNDETVKSRFPDTATIQKHTYSENWQPKDADQHQKACLICNDTIIDAHAWNNGEITTPPTHLDTGIITYTCTACGEIKTETTEKFAHSFSDWCPHDADQHKRVCDCGEIEYASHVYSSDQATSCDTCGETRTSTEKSGGCGSAISIGLPFTILLTVTAFGFAPKKKKQ